ncbi:IS21 family transposase [Bacillus wiedmannii]|uniref:IS21 family transposase n=1 Tax=Bacillus wiedmannii TaxID=1890302 RepID=UPI002FFDF81B
MINYLKILQMYFNGNSQRTISASTGHSRTTIGEVIQRANQKNITELTKEMDNLWVFNYLFPERQIIEKGYFPINWKYVHKELMKKNVTLHLLHKEYETSARNAKKIPYSYSTFCRRYRSYAKTYKLTMPIKRKPGELMEVDWVGSSLNLIDCETGQNEKVYLFIATLPYSQYFYVEGFMDMKMDSWLSGHIHAYEYFNGVTDALVSDNLKTGVIKADRLDPILNEAYRQLADHYHTVIVPARVRKPKDKASVEGTVGFVSRYIIASLRNYQCFSVVELNNRIHEKMEEINKTPFQKRAGSRESVFLEEELPFLHPLPQKTFQLSEWKTAKVQLNYHVQVDRMYYSVLFEYVQDNVEIRLSKDLVEIYYKELRIATHKRLHSPLGQHSTNTAHMPENHLKYLEHTPENSLTWADNIGENTRKLVEIILDSTIEKKALRSLLSLQNTLKKHSKSELETACETAVSVASNPTVSLVNTILKRNREKTEISSSDENIGHEVSQDYGFTRGARYFGSGKSDE